MISSVMKLFFFLAVFLIGCLDRTNTSLKYIRQERPSYKPEVFSPGFISKKDEYEFGSVFSKNGTSFFYAVDINGKAEIRYTELKSGSWSEPRTIISHKTYSFNDPFLSPSENELYFISNMPLTGHGDKKDYDIWYSIREEGGWSKPKNAGSTINSDKNEYYISFTDDETMYFASNVEEKHDFDIYASKRVNGMFQKPIRLSDSINSNRYEADVFIAPDESYIIFCSTRNDGLGRGDLYISFKKDDNTWTNAKNMGEGINSKNHELCPAVTRDGKYFFFTSNKEIYWVDAKIIDNYR